MRAKRNWFFLFGLFFILGFAELSIIARIIPMRLCPVKSHQHKMNIFLGSDLPYLLAQNAQKNNACRVPFLWFIIKLLAVALYTQALSPLWKLFAVIVESFFVAINVRSNSARAARHCGNEKNYEKPLAFYISFGAKSCCGACLRQGHRPLYPPKLREIQVRCLTLAASAYASAGLISAILSHLRHENVLTRCLVAPCFSSFQD